MNQRRPKPDRINGEFFWCDRWEGSSGQLLPLEPRGLYREMLTAAWRRGASLPNDHESIQRAVRCTAAEWARCWPKIAPYWHVREDDGRLVNDTQLEVYAETLAIRERVHQKAMKAAAASPQVIRKREREKARGGAQALPQQQRKLHPEVEPTVEPHVTHPDLDTDLLPSVERLGSVSATDGGNGHGTEPSLSPQKHPPGAVEAYVRAVHEELCKRRGTEVPLSSIEFDLAAKWHDAGVPLRVILRGLQDCSRKPPNLLYAKPAIDEAIAYHVKALL